MILDSWAKRRVKHRSWKSRGPRTEDAVGTHCKPCYRTLACRPGACVLFGFNCGFRRLWALEGVSLSAILFSPFSKPRHAVVSRFSYSRSWHCALDFNCSALAACTGTLSTASGWVLRRILPPSLANSRKHAWWRWLLVTFHGTTGGEMSNLSGPRGGRKISCFAWKLVYKFGSNPMVCLPWICGNVTTDL